MQRTIHKSRRAVLAAAIAALAGFSAAAPAQDYPTKPVRVVVPFGPGGIADVSTRIVAQQMSTQMGQQFVVENLPSAGGINAAQAVARSAPDGYTLLLMSNANAVAPSLFKSLPYDPVKDFQPVSTIGSFDLIMVVDKASPLKTVKEAVELAKKSPDKFNIGSIVTGSTQHLSAELFKSLAALDSPTVPFKTSGEVITALKTGDIQVGFEMLSPLNAQLKSGNLRAIAVAAPKRLPSMPDVPTVAETVPGYQSSSWNGWAVPIKTPRPLVDRLNQEMAKALDNPEVKKKLQDVGVDVRHTTPEGFRALLVSETDKWRKVVEHAKLEKQ
jgi:tripartite-type tricarboxylate transporter receptor subunit TctC